jgi:ribosomal protein S12 methylthiotransferase
MHRKTKACEIIRLIAKIRKIIPDVALRTSLIVGFPSETEKEFQELLRFIQDVRFDRLGVFIYSREQDTPAYNFERQLPQKVKKERFDIIMSCQQKIAGDLNKKFLDKKLEVLVEEKDDAAGIYLARTQYDAPETDGLVYVHSRKKLAPGDFVKVKIIDTLEYDLVGELL